MLKEIAPPNLIKDPIIKALLESTDPQLQKVKEQIINAVIYSRIDEIEDESLLDLLAWQFHVEGYELAKTVEEKRNLIKNAIELHRYKGTKYAVKKALKALNLSGEIKEWFEYDGQPYRFKLYMKSIMSNQALWEKLVALVNEYKNERSWLDGIGIFRNYNQWLKLSSKLKIGKTYKIGLHFNAKFKTNIYLGTTLRTSKKFLIGIHTIKTLTAFSKVFKATVFRYAWKISIGVANG